MEIEQWRQNPPEPWFILEVDIPMRHKNAFIIGDLSKNTLNNMIMWPPMEENGKIVTCDIPGCQNQAYKKCEDTIQCCCQ